MTPRHCLVLAAVTLGVARPAWPQVLTSTSNGTMAAVVAYGTMTPGSSTTPSTTQAQFRVRCNSNQGYNVTATLLSFNVTPASPADGGKTIMASDVGLGITSVDTSASSVTKPRVDTVAAGFNYNPGSVTATNGIAPYTGIAQGQARLSDLSTAKILSGPRIASNQNKTDASNFITVTMTFGALREYFTPASFTAVVWLTISNGQ